MSTYDIAAGASKAGLENLIGKVYALPAARSKLFKGSITKNVDPIGDVTLDYDVTQAPTVNFAELTDAEWQAAQKERSGIPKPTGNVFRLAIHFKATVTYSGVPQNVEGPFTAVGVVKVDSTGGEEKVSIHAPALIIDEAGWSALDKAVVNHVMVPKGLEMANQILPAATVPKIPTVQKLKFQNPALEIATEGIVVGTSLDGGAAPDLSGFRWPGKELFAVSKLTTLNAFFAENVTDIDEKDSKGGSAWKAGGRIHAKNLKITAKIDSGLKLDTEGHFDAYGELSGTGVGITKAVTCPIGAAADAIADPDNWDKVISEFDVHYKPKPMPIPVKLNVEAPNADGKQQIQLSVPDNKLPDNIQLTFTPEWSKSVTGTVLAAAVTPFIDLISVIFGKLIIKAIVGSKAQDIDLFKLPKLAQPVDVGGGVTVTVKATAPAGAAFAPLGSDRLLQEFNVAISQNP